MSRGLVRSIACAGAALAIAATPAVAAAAGAKSKPTTTPTTPTPATAPAVAKGAMPLYLRDAFFVSHQVKLDRLRIKPSKNGKYGIFTEKLSVPRAGNTAVTITHKKDAQQVGFIARRSFDVLEPSAGFGASGLFVQLMQQRLAALHF